jgi:hypothetical protein
MLSVKYNLVSRKIQVGAQQQPEKFNLASRKVQRLKAEKYNRSTQEVQSLSIGSTKKLTKSKCTKNKKIPSSAGSTISDSEKYKR